MDDAREKLKRSELNGIIELPSDFGVIKNNGNHPIPTGTVSVIYSKGSEQNRRRVGGSDEPNYQ